MFHLLRYFSIAGLIAYVIVTGIFGLFYNQLAVQDLIDMEERNNIALTQSFANSVWLELTPLIASPTAYDRGELRFAPEVARLQQVVATQMAGLSVSKIKAYNRDGVTIFSTDPRDIGKDGNANANFLAARNGQVTSELIRDTTVSTFATTLENQDVLSSYIPMVARSSDGVIMGVFELYNNVTPLLARIQAMQRKIVLGFTLALAALYALLFLIVRRADGIMRRQHQVQQAATAQLQQQQQALAAAKERERLARELHDSIGQVFGYVNTQSQAARLLLTKQPAAADALLQRLVEVAQNAQIDVRASILNLQAGLTPTQDFLTALNDYLDQFRRHHELPVKLVGAEAIAAVKFTPTVQIQLLRIIQEALTNIHKHAGARSIQIHLVRPGDLVQIRVTDDGHGFDPRQIAQKTGQSLGLQIMRDRAAEFGGDVQVQSQVGQGTQVVVQVPWPQAQGTKAETAKRGRVQTHERIIGGRSSTFFGRLAKFTEYTWYYGGWHRA